MASGKSETKYLSTIIDGMLYDKLLPENVHYRSSIDEERLIEEIEVMQS